MKEAVICKFILRSSRLVLKCLCVVMICFVYLKGLSQSQDEVEKLHKELVHSRQDTNQVMTLVNLCALYRLGNSDSSLFYGRKALQLARQIRYPRGEILALGFMSITLRSMGNLSGGLEIAFESLRIGKENGIEDLAGPALNGIGEIYSTLKDYPKAMEYFSKQKDISERTGNMEGLAYTLRDIGIVFEENNQMDSAIFYLRQAENTFRKMDREEPLIYETLGDIQLRSGNYQDALQFYKKGLSIAVDHNERRASSTGYIKIASLYKITGNQDSAIYYALKGVEEARLISQKKSIMDATALLSELYEGSDLNQSLHYLKISISYKDSLFGTGNLQAIQVLINQQEQHQKEIDASRLKYQNNLKQYTLFAGLGILILIASILYHNNHQKQKANQVLKSTLENLKATQTQLIQSEKMASLGELTAGIAHEIQNPLNFVNNFSEVSAELIEEAEQAIGKRQQAIGSSRDDENAEISSILNDVKQNLEKINHHGKRADAIVKGMLQHSQSDKGIKEPTDINALADEYLRIAINSQKAKDPSFDVDVQTSFDPAIGKINIVPQDIGKVLLNLYTNAFYACAERSRRGKAYLASTISVSTKRSANKIQITVTDNGTGIPKKIIDKIFQPFFTTKPTGQGTGLGLSLSYDIIKAHGGEIKVKSTEGEGSEFIITLNENA